MSAPRCAATTYCRRGQRRVPSICIAKQRRDRNVVRAAERPERKGERGHQSVKQRERKLRRDAKQVRSAAEGFLPKSRKRSRTAKPRRSQVRSPRRWPQATSPASDRSTKTRAPVAPSDFIAAMVSRLRSRWLFTALATPTPPTSKAVNPTSVRNCVKRSTLRSSCGRRVVARADFPAGFRQLLLARLDRALAAARSLALFSGKLHAVMSSARGCPAAQAGRAQSASMLINRRGPKPMPPASLSGSLRKRRADFDRRRADPDTVADLQIEPHQQGGIGDRAVNAAAFGKGIAQAAWPVRATDSAVRADRRRRRP